MPQGRPRPALLGLALQWAEVGNRDGQMGPVAGGPLLALKP